MPVIRGSTSQATPRGDLLVAVKERPLGFEPIYMEVFGRIDTPKSKGNIGTIPAENYHNNPTLIRRAPGGKFNRIEVTTSEKTYVCYNDGLTAAYDDSDRAEYESMFQYEAALIEILRRRVLTYREVIAATALFNTTNWPLSGTTGKNVTTEWDQANSTPIDDVRVCLEWLLLAGADPNTAVAVMSWRNALCLLNNSQIVGNSKYTQLPNQRLDQANLDGLAAKLGVRKIIVGKPIKNGSTDGVTPSYSGIWSDEYCWVGNVGMTNSPEEFCVGRTYVNMSAGGDEIADQYRDEDSLADVYRFRGTVGTQVNYTACGTLLGNIHT